MPTASARSRGFGLGSTARNSSSLGYKSTIASVSFHRARSMAGRARRRDGPGPAGRPRPGVFVPLTLPRLRSARWSAERPFFAFLLNSDRTEDRVLSSWPPGRPPVAATSPVVARYCHGACMPWVRNRPRPLPATPLPIPSPTYDPNRRSPESDLYHGHQR